MITKVLYSNKTALQNNETIPSKNKVTAEDMNEIKQVVNNNADELETKQGKEEGKGLSTNDFTDELKQKLEGIDNYDDAQIQQDISDLQDKNIKQDKTIEELKAENIELKAENERLNNDINAISVTVKAEGENITLNDTADARFKSFGISGNSWQETGDITDEEGNIIGTMPSTDFKSDIQNITGNANVTICNKNVFNLKGSEALFINGTTDYEKDDTSIKVFTTYKNQWGCVYFSVGKIKNYIGKMITLSADVELFKSGQISSVALCSIKENGTNRKEIKNTGIITQSGQIEITAEIKEVEDADLISLRIYANISSDCEKGDYTILKNIQVEVSETKTNYTEHQEQSFTFPLQEGQRLMLNDYLADDGIHHKKGRYVFTGDEVNVTRKWEDEANIFFFQRLVQYQEDTSNLQLVGCKCNKYECTHYDGGKGSMWAEKFTNRDLFAITYKISKTNIENNGVLIKDNRFSTIEELLDYLKEQYNNGTPVYFEYILAEEEIDPYTPEQQAVYDEIKKTAHSYGEQTHIFCTDEISPIFTVEARKDMNTVISNLESMIISNASEEV